MPRTRFGASLKRRIEKKYVELGYRLGWRLLYSPEDVLERTRVAFVGLNPGGDRAPAGHATFAMKSGSAYVVEMWPRSRPGKSDLPGQSDLQLQVRTLFHIIGERPENVLAGNLVPFRSRDWEALSNKDQALEFGREIWEEILSYAKPELVIGMGGETRSVLRQLLGVQRTQRVPVEWGTDRPVKGERGMFAGGSFVGLPHLSTYKIAKRKESQQALTILLGEHYHQSPDHFPL